MSEVKRYGAALTHAETSPMYPDVTGQWVKASDYDALAAQRDEGLAREAELRAVLRKARLWIEAARDGVLYPIARDFECVVGRNAENLGSMTPSLLDMIDQVLASPVCADGEKPE